MPSVIQYERGQYRGKHGLYEKIRANMKKQGKYEKTEPIRDSSILIDWEGGPIQNIKY